MIVASRAPYTKLHMVLETGIEPVTPCSSGKCCYLTELPQHKTTYSVVKVFGADSRTRTHHILLTRQALYPMSYVGIFLSLLYSFCWFAMRPVAVSVSVLARFPPQAGFRNTVSTAIGTSTRTCFSSHDSPPHLVIMRTSLFVHIVHLRISLFKLVVGFEPTPFRLRSDCSP